MVEANNMCEKIKPFSFEKLEKLLFRNRGDGQNIVYHYKNVIKKLKENNQLGTASSYELSLKSFNAYILSKRQKKHSSENELTEINFLEITPEWLNGYEHYMVDKLGRSMTTVAMYLRTLRAVFNIAMNDKEIDKEIYPFGKNKYQIHNVKNVKKALSKNELSVLFKAQPKNREQSMAKDFWFFSYTCNGMNVKDITLLKFENIKGNTFEFYRAKTINTSKSDLRPVVVHISDFAHAVIKKYANNKENNEFVFPVISNDDTELDKFRKVKNFTRFINQNIKKLAEDNGITTDISTYWARHSFATNAIRQGATMEFVGEALNHHDMKTTQGYFAGFEEESKKEMAEKLMNFD